MKSVIFIFITAFSGIVTSEELPSDFKRCSSKDISCLKDAINDAISKLASGIDHLGVPPLDPLKITKLSVGGGKIVQLVQNYENLMVSGFSKTKVDDLSFDLDKGKILMKIHIPEIKYQGAFRVKGKILILDVYGAGDFEIRLDGITGVADIDVQKYEKNGETYLKVTKIALDAVPSNVYYQYDNLFDGNKLLGDNINKVLNDNWSEIYNELKKEYLASLDRYLMKLSNSLFEKIPLNAIILD